jgi:anti-sigma factor ChrR (cupin superfamily)
MAASTSSNPSQIIRIGERGWESMSATIKFKNLWSEAASKRRVQLTRFEPGAILPMHRHLGDEFLYVIEGSISDESGTTAAGGAGYRPNGCVHTVTSKTGATVFAIISGGIEAAGAIGDAPRSQTFMLSDIGWTDAIPGVRQKPIWSDKQTKRRAVLVRFEPEAKLPRHRHVGNELIFVIEGSVADESGEVLTGDMNYRPDGCEHSVSSRNGATVLALVTGSVEMLA